MASIWLDEQQKGARPDELLMDSDIVARTTGEGLELTYCCNTCGRQTKCEVPWAELLAFKKGIKVGGTQATRQGVVIKSQCRCACVTPVLLSWDEIRNGVDMGVRSGKIIVRAAPPAPR